MSEASATLLGPNAKAAVASVSAQASAITAATTHAYEAMLVKAGCLNNCTKSAFAITSALYLSVAAAAYGYFNQSEDVTKLDLGSPTIALSLDQFGDIAPQPAPQPAAPAHKVAPAEPASAKPELAPPEPIVQKVQPKPIQEEPAPTVAPPVKREYKRHHEKPRNDRKMQRKMVQQETAAKATVPSAQPPKIATSQTSAREQHQGKSAQKVLIMGRDQHPVLTKIKQAIDGNLLYPRRARMMREQGAAIVQFTYTKQGQIKRLRLLRSTGSQELDAAAKQTIMRASASFPQVNQDFTLRLPIIFKLTS